jgi:hypothetical protein
VFSNERGVVLLEILVALTILAVAGLGLVELVSGNLRAETTARERETELGDLERLLTAHTLLTRSDLDIRLGATEIGAYVVSVQRPERELYRIAVGRVETPAVEDLVTVVFRRGENRVR